MTRFQCPSCKAYIPPEKINAHFASRGGKARKNRTISPEHQRKMQEGRKKAKEIRQEDSLK